MIKIITQKKVEEYKKTIAELSNEVENYQLELYKIQDWILKMLENNGYQIKNVPYIREQKNELIQIPCGNYTRQTEVTIIPELRIHTVKSFNCNYMSEQE